ncbi:hypothetical protein JMK10_17610 [Rhodovulum sulfidophilum]|uniref:hypothetical protein n=1 Tax=Rhodovulum sulfidophilum TaxID=35806 RepID=UPI001921B231|nr:hypothetical protein [Rhodovulum sulfidophilum]MBL3576125.1 hypothetical protein [Rhodovulum sulfidophilum]MCE8431419.1 hypothetical protein [Rhodovulum sulfidophilum]MCF4118571.1 hypothetical protein [Rhodovulum sulfidophilum]
MDLVQILEHPLFPFSDFRTNDASFLMLELYWAAVAREALGDDVAARVEPLQETDRDTENWGDPLMLDFWIPDLRRGAKVELLENTEGLPLCRESDDKINCFPSIVVYSNRRGITGPDDEIDQVCFRADMGDVARSVISHVLRMFLIEKTTPDAIEPWYGEFVLRTGEGPSKAQLAAWHASLEDEE